MARRRVRLTVFSRFLLVLLFLIPAAFIGASYFNNQDPFETVKSWINGEQVIQHNNNNNNNDNIAPAPAPNTNAPANDLAEENRQLKERVRELERQLKELKRAAEGKEKVGFE